MTGETVLGTDSVGSVYAYPRKALEDFVAAASIERDRLEQAISGVSARASRARAAVGMHRVMVSMLLEAHQELGERRRDAEERATSLIVAAEAEARAIVTEARERVSNDPSVVRALGETAVSEWMRSTQQPDPPSLIDLRGGHSDDSGDASALGAAAIQWDRPTEERDDDGDSYFAFLRGALTDDEPLDPLAHQDR